MITSGNIFQHELIGLTAKITDSSNPQFIGLNGTITNETKSMFQINTTKGDKLIPKANSVWAFSINNQVFAIDGSKIQKRPFDRIGARV